MKPFKYGSIVCHCRYKSNHERFLVIEGLQKCIKICKNSNVQRVVAAVSQCICCLVPSPECILRWHEDEFTIPVEQFHALPVLKKSKFSGFGHLPDPPDWLMKSIMYVNERCIQCGVVCVKDLV